MPCHRFGRYPCGRCPGCFVRRASDWSTRLSHEHSFPVDGVAPVSSFITLTFADGSVVDVDKELCKLFMKRLRKRLAPKRIRFYLVAEYGEDGGRPHYHAIIFGHDFSRDDGARAVCGGLYTSPILEAAWGLGYVSSGEVTDASIRYVANYVLGKEDVPLVVSLESGDERKCAPVFALMSRNPGIGAAWIDQHAGETYRDDNVVSGGFRRQPPRYYDQRTFKGDDSAIKALRSARRSARLKVMNRSPRTWLANNDPLRRKAAVEIEKSKRAMRPRGEL